MNMQDPLLELLNFLVDREGNLAQTVAHLRIELRHLPLEPLVVLRRAHDHLSKLLDLLSGCLVCFVHLFVGIGRLLNSLLLFLDQRLHRFECLRSSRSFLLQGVADVPIVLIE